jgi:putative hydrolase of the HAD superfamily
MSAIRAVFIDVGGPLYDDNNFLVAVSEAVREILIERGEHAPPLSHIKSAFDRARNTEGLSIRETLAAEFLGSSEHAAELHAVAKKYWLHPEGSLYGDAVVFLRAIKGVVKVAVVANQEEATKDALIRDGVGELIDVWGISATVGLEKPSPEFFQWALDQLGVRAGEVLHIGNRFDTDVLPAKALGMRAAWLLRGEAPDNPPADQVAKADFVLTSLEGFADTVIDLAQGAN